MDYVRRAVWGILYADDVCIVSRSPQGLAKMMEGIVEVCRAFALTVSTKNTKTMCITPPRTPRTMVLIKAAGQIYKQVQSFTYQGGAVTETPDMSVETAKQKTRIVKRPRKSRASCMDALRGPSARNTTPNPASYITGSFFASSGRSGKDLTQPCP